MSLHNHTHRSAAPTRDRGGSQLARPVPLPESQKHARMRAETINWYDHAAACKLAVLGLVSTLYRRRLPEFGGT